MIFFFRISAKWKSLPIAQQKPYIDEERRRKSEVVKVSIAHLFLLFLSEF